jgi:predicted ATPase
VYKDLHIVTGAPGTGKSAILSRLEPEVRVIAEPAREALAEQRAIGGAGTSDRDPPLFVSLLLERSIEKRDAVVRAGGVSVFDRASPTASPTRWRSASIRDRLVAPPRRTDTPTRSS